MIPKQIFGLALVAVALSSSAWAQQFFVDRSAFLSNVRSDYYEEKFDNFSEGEPLDGHQEDWDAPGAYGFNWTASAEGSGNDLLYSLNGAISTSSHEDRLVFDFSGNPVYAFGGQFWGTMYDGFPMTADVEFESDTGEVFNQTVSLPSFIGLLSNVPIARVTIDASSANGSWATADNVITGDLIPTGDLDGDGMTNYAEQLAGTNPTDASSNLRITAVAQEDENFIISYLAVAGKTYRLEYKNALSDPNWSPASVPNQTASLTGPAQFTDPATPLPTQRFYRVVLVDQGAHPSRATISPVF